MKNTISFKKQAVLSLSLLSILVAGTVRAADAPAKPAVQKEASPQENQLFSKLLSAVVNDIEEIGQFSVHIDGQIPKGGSFQGQAKVGGLIHFNDDIEMTLDNKDPAANPSSNAATQNIMASLIPKIQLKLKGFFANVGYANVKGNEIVKVDFYSGYDKAKKVWISNPIVAGVYNKINKGLSLSLSSVEVTRKPDPRNDDRLEISGKCAVKHRIYDFTVDKQVMKPVRCEFSGFEYKSGGYQIDRLIYSDQQ